jgi:aspartate-semialdehyde dehydrogenase
MPTPLHAAAAKGRDPCWWAVSAAADDAPDRTGRLFVSGDNLRKGAALNAVQIAEAPPGLGASA